MNADLRPSRFGRGKPEGPSAGRYLVRTKSRQQTIWGFGFEVQSDSIGSGNQGLPKSNSSVPHDLLPDQRASFFKEVMRIRLSRLSACVCVCVCGKRIFRCP